MAEEAALRAQLDEQRDRIGHTVDQIENRVRPGRVVRRKRNQLTNQFTDWKDRIMGSDDQHSAGLQPSGSAGGSGPSMGQRASSVSHDVGERASDLASTVGDTPDMVRRRTRGNPVAPGLIAFGAGLLVAALLPETRREQEAVRKIQPELDEFASEAAHTGKDIGTDVKESAREAATAVKDSATSAASDVASDSKDALGRST